MIDLHTHILPNIDDGASSYEEALKMLSMMIKNGVKTVVATPHFDFENNNINDFLLKRKESLVQLKFEVRNNHLDIKILSGAELMFTQNLGNYDLSDFTIEGTDYLLIELSTIRNEPTLETTLETIMTNGYIPILAHVERYKYLTENSQRLVNLIEKGVLMQINSKSLKSRKKKSLINALKKRNLVHVISSDAHNLSNRKPDLIANEIETQYAEYQKAILSNQLIAIKKPKKVIKTFGKYF